MPSSSLKSSNVNSRLQQPKHQIEIKCGVPQPDKLAKFFDHNKDKPTYLQFPQSGSGSGSRTRNTTYNPVTSWEGQSQCTETFGKLDSKTGVVNIRRPQGLAGTRVIETEAHPEGGIFNNGPDEGNARLPLPLTKEQIDTEFGQGNNENTAEYKILDANRKENSYTLSAPKFECLHLDNPMIQASEIPKAFQIAGHQCDGALLTVEERKNANLWETKNQFAMKTKKAALLQKQRLYDLIQQRHPQGLQGVDSANNLKSDLYSEKRALDQQRVNRHKWKKEERKKMHMYISQSEPRLGYNPFNHHDNLLSSEERTKIDKVNFLQSKKFAGPKHDTFDRVFGKDPIRDNPLRRQKLYDESTGGKDFTITQHHMYPFDYKPTYVKESSRINKKLSHPSQQSLERGRNMQGFVTPGNVLRSPFLDPAF